MALGKAGPSSRFLALALSLALPQDDNQ